MNDATIHASAVAQGGRAVLLLGPSGAGKSDLALRLIDRGWRLVADDRVVVTVAGGVAFARAPAVLTGLIEVREVGIVPLAADRDVPLALAIDLAGRPERLPQVGAFLAGTIPLPMLAIDAFGVSAPLKVEQALRLHGLVVKDAAMPTTGPLDDLPPPPNGGNTGAPQGGAESNSPQGGVGSNSPQSGVGSNSPQDGVGSNSPQDGGQTRAPPMLIISGMSGAGKSTALKALEDLDYEAVDNLPLGLVETLLASAEGGDSPQRPLAFGIDTRTRAFDAEALAARLRDLRSEGIDVRLIYLDCADDELVRRFSETRRRHPLAADRPAIDGVARERELTGPLKRWADLVIDTTDLTATDLRRRIAERLGRGGKHPLTLTVQSFGFAHGLPRNADLVFDMRFLANPHWDMALRPLTGADPAVAAFVAADPAYGPAIDRIADLLLTLLPSYGREGKAYLTIAIGCTGGRHRSVAVARELTVRLQAVGHAAALVHRDVGKQGNDAAVLTATPQASEQSAT